MQKQSFIFFLIFLLSSFLFSQKINRYDKHGQRTGKWITYSDSAKTKKTFDGKYRNGISVGKCLYYSRQGILEKKEVNRFKRMKTRFYYSNGQIKHKGMSRIENLPDKVHFYFYGKWKNYNQEGKLISYTYYKKGEEIRTKSLIKTAASKDSFCVILPKIENLFLENNRFLIDTLALCWNSPGLAEKYRNKIYRQDSLSFIRVINNLNYYGYPTKEECGEASNVPFFIISHAPIKMREKYIELFRAAAGLGYISKSSLAYYIDKIKVGKGEKQVYGTQYYLNKERQSVYYPSIDPDNLMIRRKEIGLED